MDIPTKLIIKQRFMQRIILKIKQLNKNGLNFHYSLIFYIIGLNAFIYTPYLYSQTVVSPNIGLAKHRLIPIPKPTLIENSPNLTPKDYLKLQEVSSLNISKDHKWVVYTVSVVDTAKNKRTSHLWLQNLENREAIQLSFSNESETSPKFSPDGKYISYLSSKDGENDSQVWIMDRRGGEGKKITSVKGDIEDMDWSPDGKKMVLAIKDPEPKPNNTAKTQDPIVIDRYHFKKDIEGFLGHLHTHLYILDVTNEKIDTLTKGKFDVKRPSWSPDGSKIVFVSNQTEDEDRNSNSDIFTIEAHLGGQIKQLTHWTGSDESPEWSPDGKQIAYLQSNSDKPFIMYDQQNILCVMDGNGDHHKSLTLNLDRSVKQPTWSDDGKNIGFLVVDDRRVYIGDYDFMNSKLNLNNFEDYSLDELNSGPGKSWIALLSKPNKPFEIYKINKENLDKISQHNDNWLNNKNLAQVKGFNSISKDGTKVSGILYIPSKAVSGKKLPFILFIHGGPVDQDDYQFDFERQVLAQAGYVVATVNYRGSDGRGIAFAHAIYNDWGNKEVMDLLGAIDTLVHQGIIDPERIGIGGWSYGGILTNYCIASDTRFKAACSGAGSSLQLSMYGVDEYVLQYDQEIGPPWKNPEQWIKLSYPYFKADKIKTPTLFMASEKDFNVPSVGAEQMYQAFKSIGIPTQLVIYPDQFHSITVPSYIIDRLNRYIAWYNKYLLF